MSFFKRHNLKLIENPKQLTSKIIIIYDHK